MFLAASPFILIVHRFIFGALADEVPQLREERR